MSPKPKIHIRPQAQHQVLDARTLGRPVHLLKDFAAELRDLLGELFRQALNRRYRADYQLGVPHIEAAGAAIPSGPWLSAEHAPGRIACLLERSLVLSVMHLRYGSAAVAHQGTGAQPETTTEERLHGLLSAQLLQGLAERLMANANAAASAPAPADTLPTQRLAPAADAFLVSVPVTESRQGLQSTLRFAIDAHWMNQLLRQREPRRSLNKPAAALPQPHELAARLPLKLVARLLQTDLPLGELMDLQPGAVIPISLKATEVLVDGERLFTASVAEHQGKLVPDLLCRRRISKQPVTEINTMMNDTHSLEALLADLPVEDALVHEPAAPARPSRDLPRMMRKIPVTLTLEVGEARISLADLMAIGADSVVELNTLAGEPLTLKANGCTIGRAEVVVSGENYGLKVIEIAGLDLDNLDGLAS